MRTTTALLVAALAAAAGLTGCPSDTCPLETPQVNAMPDETTCVQDAGLPVGYPVQLCPTCNQTGATCVADLSAARAATCPAPPATCGDIFLDVKVEACTDTTSCGGTACNLNPLTCSFTAPSAAGRYNVITVNGLTGATITTQMDVIPSGPEFCELAGAGSASPGAY
ncbi:MAG TPA: hypothetical protein VFL83_15240 [Anaeromyxobacter sp.]|nr:hypothetical protein [Anaeromyxobacter sp.]